MGFPDGRITVVNNTLDTRELLDAQRQVSGADLERLRRHLGLRGTKTCIFVASLTPERNMPYLIEASQRARERLPDFELMILGTGPEEGAVRQLVSPFPWIKLIGPRFGAERVPYFMLAKLLLIPGMVGLHVQDSFAMQVPLVTLDLASHSPEIVYVTDGRNGRILPRDTTPARYADAVAALLLDEGKLEILKAGCQRSAEMYSVEDMCDRFATGILRALERS